MSPARRPQWQQATALITIGAGSAATGLTFVPMAAADLTSPASVTPVTLLALEHANAPAPGRDGMLRAAIVHIARHFQRLAQTRSPAEMEAMIWQYASTDGANHGPSCAAFASLTLELGSHIAGLDSWVSGGTSYPWPVHAWADGRVDPNPASPGVVSVLQDAQAHGRWHPVGDGYAPQPGDWVLFDGHVEVVTKYLGGVLHTIGGDSLPNMSVNAHEYSGPLQDQGVAGFVDNGVGMSKAASAAAHGGGAKHNRRAAAIPGSQAPVAPTSSGDLSPSAGPASSAGPVSHDGAPSRATRGAASSGGAASGGAASGGAASGGAASGRAASGGAPAAGPAASAARGTMAHATGQPAEFAPRAIAVPRAVPRARFAQAARALSAQGAMTAPRGEQAPGPGAAVRADAPQRPSAPPARKAGSGAGGAAPRAEQRPQHAGQLPQHANRSPQHAGRRRATTADVPATGLRPARPHHARRGEAAIPGLFKGAHQHHAHDVSALPPYHRHDVPPSNAPQPGTTGEQAFINQVADGAIATQEKYGVPASVTIAQAIDESGWGQSLLATNDHNLFGIKGTGPAGSDQQPTQEVINGQVVNLSASFQIYENIAQSIEAHGRLLAHSGDYAGAMSQSKDPNAFAAALTGVYATDPNYGAKLIQLMKQYDLYRFNQAAARGAALASRHGAQPPRSARGPEAKQQVGAQHSARSLLPQVSPGPRKTTPGRDRRPTPQQPGPIGNPVPVQPGPIAEPAPGQPAPIANPAQLQPGPMTPVREAKPARATKTGASVAAAQQAGAPRSANAADRTQALHHDAATPPAALLYPGRSTRPAPLAHPARPTDLARQSGPAPGTPPGQAGSREPVQHPEGGAHPAPGPSRAGAKAGSAQPTAQARPGSGTQSGSSSAQGGANFASEPTIPGVPHAADPQAGRAHARGPIGRPRPAHPNARRTPPTTRTRLAGPIAPGRAAGADAGAQRAAAPAARPEHAGPAHTRTPHTAGPEAAPTVGHAGSAMIPGLQHQDHGQHPDAGLSIGAPAAPSHATTAMAQPGGSSIPGAQQGAAVGPVPQPPASHAAARGHAPTAPTPSGPSDIPGAQQAAGPVPGALADPAAAPSRSPAATLPSGSSNIPGAQQGAAGSTPVPSARPAATPNHAPSRPATAPAGRAAAPRHPAGPVGAVPAPVRTATTPASQPTGTGHASPRPGRAATRGGATGPSSAPAPAAPAPRPAGPRPAAARPAPVSANPARAAANPKPAAVSTPVPGGADVPGLVHGAPAAVPLAPAGQSASSNGGSAAAPAGSTARAPGGSPASTAPAPAGGATLTVYHAHMPPSVREAFVKSAKTPLVRAEHLYRDVASHTGIRWELLAACDWMQCKARHGYSPVYGEKLGALNPDDTCYRTKSAALEQCASDLVQLARSVYQLDIATSHELPVRDLANVFAAFRWGGLLRQHCTSAMDFPYSVAGLTADHIHMRWPNIDEPNAPDKPGSRFRQSFGAVPVVLGLNYQALM